MHPALLTTLLFALTAVCATQAAIAFGGTRANLRTSPRLPWSCSGSGLICGDWVERRRVRAPLPGRSHRIRPGRSLHVSGLSADRFNPEPSGGRMRRRRLQRCPGLVGARGRPQSAADHLRIGFRSGVCSSAWRPIGCRMSPDRSWWRGCLRDGGFHWAGHQLDPDQERFHPDPGCRAERSIRSPPPTSACSAG